MKRTYYKSKLNAPLDFVEVRTNILDFLALRGPQTTEQIIKEFKGRYGPEPIVKALRYLREDRILSRATNTSPWTPLSRPDSTSGPLSL